MTRTATLITSCLLLLALLGPITGRGQSWQWARGNASGASFSVCSAVAMRNGSTVVAGYFSGTLALGGAQVVSSQPGNRELFVARFNGAGTCTQAVRVTGDGAQPTALAIDAGNNVVLTGTFLGTVGFGPISITSQGMYTGEEDIFVARLSAAGTWTQAVGLGTPYYEASTGLALDDAGTATVVGSFQGPTLVVGQHLLTNANGSGTLGDVFVARLTAAGTWSQAFRAGGPGHDKAYAVAVDDHGTATVVGSFLSNGITFGAYQLPNFTPTSDTEEIFVARLSAAGVWTRALRAGEPDGDRATAVALDCQGRIVVAGIYHSTLRLGALPGLSNQNSSTEEVFVARLDTTGTWQQAQKMSGTNEESVVGLAVDSANNVLVGGAFRSRVLYVGNTMLTNHDQTNNSPDVFVACLSPANTWLYAAQAGGDWGDDPLGLAADGRGNCTVVGEFVSPTMTFGPYALPNASPNIFFPLMFAGRLAGPVPTAARPAAPRPGVALFPNPTRSTATLTLPAATTPRPVLLLDALGRPVRQQALPAHATSATLNVAGLAPGLYVVRCGLASGRLLVE